MNFNPADLNWENRDRFILSGGHGSSLLYALLHMFGCGLTKEDLMNFRQLDSLTPGHPEYGHTAGVEATTGPLGAGMIGPAWPSRRPIWQPYLIRRIIRLWITIPTCWAATAA